MDLFDFVRAAPPPQTVREPPKQADTNVDAGSDIETNTTRLSLSPERSCPILKQDENTVQPPSSPMQKLLDTSPKTTAPICLDDSDDEPEKDNDQDIGDNDDDNEQPQLPPPKTKAQQKMFMDLPLNSKDKKGNTCLIKECFVRIKRLSPKQIERLSRSSSRTPKRGPTHKRAAYSNSPVYSPSPPKKRKTNNKVHIKVSLLENGAKQRSQLLKAREHTPPPNKSSLTKRRTTSNDNKLLVERYGSRFFNCVVKVKRLKHPPGSPTKRTPRKSKSNLSVSFCKTVEILGSKPRKTYIASSPKAKLGTSVPTRLQRVDATGNVLEDIELSPNMVLSSPSSCRSSASKKGRNSASNGGRRGSKLKRPSVRVPVTGLASLRIHDSQEDEPDNGGDEEYIVPNELPENCITSARRPCTLIPVKKIEVTTTVSDNEDAEEPEPESNTQVKSVNSEIVKSPAKNTDAAKQEQTDSVKEQSSTENKLPDAEKEESQSKDAQLESKKKPQTEQQSESENQPESASQPVSEKQSEPEQQSEEVQVIKPANMEQEQTIEERKLDAGEQTNNEMLLEQIDSDEVTSDDILEIQTSLEDEQQLLSPDSRPSESKPPQTLHIQEPRMESPESEHSFKSAHELETDTIAPNTVEQSPRLATPECPTTTSTANDFVSPSDSAITFNSSEPQSGASSIPQPPFSTIDEIPSLDDDELGQLVEPIFQLNSRHAISRSSLDDIMTVLES